MIQKVICISLILFLCTYLAKSQESLGFSLDKYSGTHLIDLNPAMSGISEHRWDFTLGAVHGFGFSDYGFLRSASLANLAGNARDGQVVQAQPDIPDFNPGVPLVIFDENGGEKKLSGHFEVTGPSILFGVTPTLKVGLFTKARGNISSFQIPEGLGFYELNNARFLNFQLELDPANLSAMYWQEIGIHASKQLGPLTFGLNAKYLNGTEGLFIENEESATYPFDINTLSVDGIPVNLEFGFTNSSLNNEEFRPFIDNGIGMAWDIGVTYQIEQFRIGASILDFGRISFTQNTEIFRLAPQSTVADLLNYDLINTPREFLDLVREDFEVDYDTNSDFKIGLPTALSIQGDLHLMDNYYVSAALTQRVPVFPNSLRRDNTLSVIPRYQSKWFSAFLPVTVYEYSRLRVGAAARFGFLTIGSDHIFSTFINTDFRGSDIYVRLSVFPFQNQTLGDRKSFKGGKGKGGLDCYTF